VAQEVGKEAEGIALFGLGQGAEKGPGVFAAMEGRVAVVAAIERVVDEFIWGSPIMAVEHIEFSLVHGTEDEFPRPIPAYKEIPEWYRGLPAEAEALGIRAGTVKNCPPFLEAMTCGYIVPLAADITVARDKAGAFHGKGPTFQDQSSGQTRITPMVQSHQPVQVKGSPLEMFPVIKIHNPWLIRTSPGYSTLFLAPLNRFQMLIYPIAGLVETDIFYREVHFPAVLTIPPGTSTQLPRGMPFVQVIPIKRDEFDSRVVPLDRDRYAIIMQKSFPKDHNYYKDEYWRKKNYH
jgi:hypothetical protein